MVIQVYTKPRTCHLVKYQRLLSLCISSCFNHTLLASECYIFMPFSLSCILEGTRSQTDNSEIGEYNTCYFTHTLTTISLSLSIHILPFLTQEQTTNFSTYSLVQSYITFYLSSFLLVIPNSTSLTTTTSLHETRHYSCSGYEPGPDAVLKQTTS